MGIRGQNQRGWASSDLIIIIVVVVQLGPDCKIKMLCLSKVSRPRTYTILTIKSKTLARQTGAAAKVTLLAIVPC